LRKYLKRIKDAWAVLTGKKHAKAYAKRTIKKSLQVQNEVLPGVEG
jgi:hypothetical protein